MKPAFRFVLILTAAFSLSTWAMEPYCGPDLASGTAAPAFAKLTPETALAVVGQASKTLSARTQISRAANFVMGYGEGNFRRKVEELETLFGVIQQSQIFGARSDWQFKKMTGIDGSAGFYGSAGHFFLIRPDGKLWKGLLDIDNAVKRDGTWDGTYDYIHPFIADPAKLTPEQAHAIVGTTELMNAGPQLANLMKHMMTLSQASFDYQVEALETMLNAISECHFGLWKFQKFTAADGSVGFSGDRMNPDAAVPERSFILVTQNGQIFKGKLDVKSVNDNGAWNGKSISMDLVKP